MKSRFRIFAVSVLLGILVFGLLPLVEALIQPPLVRYKYAFADDPDFNINSPSSGAKWKTGITDNDGSLWAESYTYITNQKWYGRLKTTASMIMPWDVVYIQEGLPPHQQTYNSWFLASNTGFSNAVPVEAVVFNLNETAALSTDYKMYVRAKLTRKDALQAEGAIFNLGIHMGFQFEMRDNLAQQFLLSDYTQPDPHYGDATKPWTVSSIMSDIMLISEQFWWPRGWDVWGGSGTHQIASDYDDVVNNRYYGLGTTLDPGIWVYFAVPLKQRIEEVFADVQNYMDQIEENWERRGQYYDFTLTSLILRNIALYIEGVNVDVEAQVDYVWFSSADQNDAWTGGDAGDSFDTATLTNSEFTYPGELYPTDDTEDWYKFYASSGQTIYVTMTPPAGVDYDLILYDPNVVYKDGSYADAGITDTIYYSADSSGNWRIKIYSYGGIGPYTFHVYVYTPSPPGGGAGGCPYVSTWNGSDYVLDNNLLPASESAGQADVTDYYMLEQMLTRGEDGTYALLLSEFENEHDFLDRVQLTAVDHQSEVNVAVSPYGEILTYHAPSPPASALDDNNRNVKSLLSSVDGDFYEGYNGSHVTLNFGDLNVSQGAKLVIRSDYPFPTLKSPVYIQTMNSKGGWQTVATIHTRAHWYTDIIDMSKHLPDARGNLKVRLQFVSNDKIDYVGLDTSSQATVQVQEGQLISATHSIHGDVTAKLLYDDQNYTELEPIQEIQLTFSLPPQTMESRNYIIITEGHYYKIQP